MARFRREEAELKRKLNVDLPASVHKRLRVDAANREMTITDRLIQLIEANCPLIPTQERIVR